MTQQNKLGVPDYLQSWLQFLHRQGKSQHTIGTYERSLNHFIAWYQHRYQAPLEAEAVMPRDVRDWKAYQQTAEKAAPATINQRLVAVNRFFQ